MKYLIQYTFSIKNPYYLFPNFLNYYIGRNSFNNLFRCGVGKQEEELFGRDKYYGTELTGIITGVFKKNWEFDKKRINAIKKQPAPIEVFHACVSKSVTDRPSFADWDLNLCESSDYTKKGIEASIYLAKDLIAENPAVNFHFGRYLVENRDKALENQIENLRFAANLAKQEKVIVTLENDYQKNEQEGAFGSSPEEIFEILKAVNSEWIKICFDWGHANIQARNLFNTGKIKKNDLETFDFQKRFIEKLGNKIIYAHLHYNFAHRFDEKLKKKNLLFLSKNKTIDYHMPLNKISGKDAKHYLDTLKLLKNETAISKYGKILIELSRDKFFNIIPYNFYGANTQDALESLKIVKEIFKE